MDRPAQQAVATRKLNADDRDEVVRIDTLYTGLDKPYRPGDGQRAKRWKQQPPVTQAADEVARQKYEPENAKANGPDVGRKLGDYSEVDGEEEQSN